MPETGATEATGEGAVAAAIRQAVTCLESELHDDAILACETALKQHSACAEAFFLLGLVTLDLDEPTQALKLLETAHELDPTVQEFAEALAATYARLGKVTDGLFHAKVATTLAPHPTITGLLPARFGSFFRNLETTHRHIYRDRARLKLEAGDFAGAAADSEKQLELTPGDVPTLRVMAHAGYGMGQLERSMAAFHALLHGDAPLAEDFSGLAQTLSAAGRPAEAGACHRTAADLAPERADLHSRWLADLSRDPETPTANLAAAHQEWQRRHAAGIEPRQPAGGAKADPERPLRVAYLSGSFYDNDLMRLLQPVLEAHDRKEIKVFCYGDGTRGDMTTERLMRRSDKWTDITAVDDETVWQILRGDEIDIAVDLSGLDEGGRPLVFARRPAPVAISWLGTPHPSGVAAIDHFVTDEVAWPADCPQPTTGEAVWRLPRAAFAYSAPGLLPPVGPLPAQAHGHLTLGVSGELGSIGPRTVAHWAGLLRSLDRARLLICNRFDQDQSCIDRPLELFAHLGLRNRVDVVNMADNFQTEFDFYQHVDLALSNGSQGELAENCRALWMGVPLLVRSGDRHGTRLGVSLVTAAGHPEWAVGSAAALAALAGDLSADLGRLAELRAGLRDQVSRTPLADVAGFTRTLEQAYRAMWRNHCAS